MIPIEVRKVCWPVEPAGGHLENQLKGIGVTITNLNIALGVGGSSRGGRLKAEMLGKIPTLSISISRVSSKSIISAHL